MSKRSVGSGYGLWYSLSSSPRLTLALGVKGWPSLVDWIIRSNSTLIVLLVATAIFLGCIASPPSLMDDVDAANAQIAREHACLRRLGDAASQRCPRYGKATAPILVDRPFQCRVWCA